MANNQPRDVEERLAFLEREANYWRVKFEELEKWRENLEDWVIANIGVPKRARTPGSNPWMKYSPSSQLSSPSNNGWSPDSSDASTSVNNSANPNVQPKAIGGEDVGAGRRSTYDFDKECDDIDENSQGKRKRGRPKKNPEMTPGVSSYVPGPNMTVSNVVSTPEVKVEPGEMNPWAFGGESVNMPPAVPVKRGRGRPRKIKTDEEDDDKEKKKPGRKKRDPVMLLAKACDMCGMEFETNQDLMSHKRIAHPEKFHKCNVCNETYLHSGFLARHMETHTLDRDFKCNMCISSFNTYQLLKVHVFEKHGMDMGRQNDWKRDGDISAAGMNRAPVDGYGLGPPVSSQSSSIMSPSIPNCGVPNNDLVRNDFMNPHNVSSHPQFTQQQQQQQHALLQQHHNQHHQQIQSPHHMHLHQNQPSHPHHSEHMQQQQHQRQQQQQQQQRQHPHHLQTHPSLHHHPQQQHSYSNEDEENDMENGGFPLDFGCNGSDTLPPLFDPPVSDPAMNNYLNSMEQDALQLY